MNLGAAKKLKVVVIAKFSAEYNDGSYTEPPHVVL